MSTTTIVVGDVTLLAQEEIEALNGTVRQICEEPRLFLVQVPHSDWIFDKLINPRMAILKTSKRMQEDRKIGTKDRHGYLLHYSNGWMCEYQQHPYDIVHTSLCSFNDPPSARDTKANEISSDEYSELADLMSRDEHLEILRVTMGKSKDSSLLDRDHAILEQIKQEEPSAYNQYLWSLAHDLTTFGERPDLCTAFQAYITLSSYDSPAIRKAITTVQGELATLDEDTTNKRIIDIVDAILTDAESLLSTLSEWDREMIEEAELAYRLHALRANMLTEREIEIAVSDFGDHEYLDAQPDVARLLTHPLPAIRRRALETLFIAWGDSDYKETAFQFLSDPDPDCRKQGMRCLNSRHVVIDDLRVLIAYAHIAANQNEQPSLRLSAYDELNLATGGFHLNYDYWLEIENFLDKGGALERAPWVDWRIVQSLLSYST